MGTWSGIISDISENICFATGTRDISRVWTHWSTISLKVGGLNNNGLALLSLWYVWIDSKWSCSCRNCWSIIAWCCCIVWHCWICWRIIIFFHYSRTISKKHFNKLLTAQQINCNVSIILFQLYSYLINSICQLNSGCIYLFIIALTKINKTEF